jgi:uncharacterized protein YbjT (DUF2867 family)
LSGRVAILAGSGKTGRAVASALGARGTEARPLGREAWPRLSAALVDCPAVYLMAPNMHPDEPEYVAEALAAARRAGAGRVVYHSVAAPYTPSMPHHLGKAESEDLVRRSGLDWTILQPCAYVQNFVPALLNTDPTLRVPYRIHVPFGLVDLADVGEAAATVLLDPAHTGATYELGGPRPVSVADVAAAAADFLGRPVPAERLGPDIWVATGGAGMEPRERDWLLAMFAYYDRHGLPTGSLPLQTVLGRTPTGLAQTIARELVAV